MEGKQTQERNKDYRARSKLPSPLWDPCSLELGKLNQILKSKTTIQSNQDM